MIWVGNGQIIHASFSEKKVVICDAGWALEPGYLVMCGRVDKSKIG